MDSILSSEIVVQIVIFIAGILTSALVLGARALAESFKKSSNKLDDAFIPLLERIADALEKKSD